jgi:hypothetical protein
LQGVLDNLSESIVACRGLYPEFNAGKCSFVRKAGVMALKLNQFRRAEALLMEARDIFAVIRGEDHPGYLETARLVPVLQDALGTV